MECVLLQPVFFCSFVQRNPVRKALASILFQGEAFVLWLFF